MAYEDSLNLYTVNGIPPLCLKLASIQAQKLITNGVQYYQVTYDMEVKRDTWVDYLLGASFAGFDYKLNEDGLPNWPDDGRPAYQFFDPISGQPLAQATLLNGRGRRRTDARTKLTTAMTNSALNTTLDHPVAVNDLFPPTGIPDKAGPCDDVFNVRVNDEIMTVVGGYGTGSWTVLRSRAGTTVANHLLDAKVYLEAYYRNFVGRVLDMLSLNLPVF